MGRSGGGAGGILGFWGGRRGAERLGEDRFRLAWKDAYDIHVWGFHEAKYDVRDVKAALPPARWLVEFVKSRAAGGDALLVGVFGGFGVGGAVPACGG
nr:PaREP1 family protein [Pyrobaculum neutrophilum]